jgi:amino acid transporter
MSILIAVFVGAALLITLAATVLTDFKVWRLVRESHQSLRRLPPERRRRALRLMVGTYVVVFGYTALLLVAPFGVRRTLTYFVILPFVLIVPVAVIAAGIRGFRGQRRGRPPDG